MGVNKQIIFFAALQTLLLFTAIAAEESQGRDFGAHHPSEYPIYPYPPNYYFDDSIYFENPGQSLMNKGLNFLLLKLEIFGIIKAVIIFLFALFLLKLPVILLKAVLLKSLFLPVFAAPFLIHYYLNHAMDDDKVKPGGGNVTKPPSENSTVTSAGRHFTEEDDPMSLTWKSIKMFAENEKCMERIYCILGATNNHSHFGGIFSRRILKIFAPDEDLKSPLMKAYNSGRKTQKCPKSDFTCQTPELIIQQGTKKLKIL